MEMIVSRGMEGRWFACKKENEKEIKDKHIPHQCLDFWPVDFLSLKFNFF